MENSNIFNTNKVFSNKAWYHWYLVVWISNYFYAFLKIIINFLIISVYLVSFIFWFNLCLGLMTHIFIISVETVLNFLILFLGLALFWCFISKLTPVFDLPLVLFNWKSFSDWLVFQFIVKPWLSICYAICLFFLFRGIIYYANGLSPLHLLLIGESNADSNQLDNSGGVPNGNCGGSGPFGNENNNVAFSSSCNQEKKEQPESDLGCNFIVCKNEIQVCAITDRSSGSVIRKTIDLSGVPEKALQQIHEAFICCSDLDHQFLSKSVNNYFDILSSILEEYFNNPYLTKKQKQYIFDLKVALYDGKFSIFRESPLLFSRSPICTESFAYGFRALISHRLEDVVQSGRAYLVDETVLRYSGLPGHWYYGSTVSHEGDFVKSCAYATSSKWKGNIDLKVPLNINGHVLDLAKGESQNMTPFFCTKFCKSSGMLHLFDGDAYLFLKNKQNKMALTAAVASLGFLCGEKICYCKNLLNNLDAD